MANVNVTIQPVDLIRFISNIPVTEEGAIPINTIESEPLFQSDLFKPSFFLTILARMGQNIIKSGKIEVRDIPLGDHTIVSKAINTDISSYEPRLYLLLRATVLESFSLVYYIEQEQQALQYVTQKDIQRIRENINYLADYMSTVPKYRFMIDTMRTMNISLGYLEHQIEVILYSATRGGRYLGTV